MKLVALLLAVFVTQSDTRDLEQLAREGWRDARAAAALAGTPESLAPAAQTLVALDKISSTTKWPLQVAYARSLIAAAMAAAQDERAEMSLHLTHARSLSERLATSALRAEWPLPIDEAEGELRLEVDEYEEAFAAFERALPGSTRGTVWVGYGRSAARLGKGERACYAYRRALLLTLSAAQREEALDYAVRCQ